MVKNLPAIQETRVWSLGWEDPLEKGMTTHSSILAGKIPWTEEPGGLQSMGSQRVRHNWATILIHSGTHTQYLKVLISTYLSIFILKTYQAPDPAAIGCYMQCGLWPPLWPWPLCMETLFTFSAFMLICFSHIQFCETLWTISYQAPLPMGFSRQEYWSGVPLPSELKMSQRTIQYLF